MKTYIGTKVIQAEPMMGPLGSESPDRAGYRVVYEDGYVSWSPAEAFNKAYRQTDAMTFGDALVMLKAGKKVTRAGWNGKGMWVQYWKPIHSVDLPYIVLMYPVNSQQYPRGARVPWLASQTDVLAEDWQVLE